MSDIPSNYTTEARFDGHFLSAVPFYASYSGSLETAGDEDWIQVTLLQGGIYNFAAHVFAPTHLSVGDASIRIFDGSGTQVASNDDDGGSGNSLISFTPAATGQYFISIASFNGDPGEYAVSLDIVSGLTNVLLGDGPDTYSGNANERILGGKDNDTINMNAASAAHGDQGDDVITGGSAFARIFGGLGNDRLSFMSEGGVLSGDAGNDILVGGPSVDWIFGGPGADSLSGGSSNDRLSGGDDSDSLSGGAGNEIMLGGDGDDVLNGGGDADRMAGEGGNDTYLVDNTSDVVSELATSGTDTVISSISFSLVNSAKVFGALERLSLSGNAAINGTGNSLANTIFGNAAANILDGGLGNDVLIGGNGNDTLNGGVGNDVLNGGAGFDRLNGGAGNDTLIGGAGNNVFVFNTAPSTSANRDIVRDFTNTAGNNDIFHMENAVFAKLGGGATHALNPAFFRAGAAALDANDFIVYNKATGILSYDVNGNGAGGAVQLAVLIGKPTLTAGDFLVI